MAEQATPRNEAAKWLRDNFTMHGIEDWTPGPWEQLDAALAEERRHVIEQIRSALDSNYVVNDEDAPRILARVARLLDDLSTPAQP